MRKSIVGLSVLVTLLCVFLLVQKNREVEKVLAQAAAADAAAREAQARAAVAEEGHEAIEAKARQQEQRSKNLQAQLGETRAKVTEAQKLRQGSNEPGGKGLSEIFRDQAMKEMLKDEAKSGVAREVKSLFDSGLAEKLHLNPEQADALKQLLLTKGSICWEKILMPMMTGELDEAGMAAAGKSIRQELEQNAAQIRALVGDDGFNLYESFDKTHTDRAQLKKFAPQFAEAGQQLNSEQQSQLLALMMEERLNFKFENDISDPLKLDFDHWYDNFTEEKIEAYMQQAEQLNGRMLERAQAVLSPEQLALLKSFLTRELQQARLTARMTTATFAKH
ncbi:MAG: hypothetical protein JWM68_1040 [Verrucomicrobiales bacterium]|nr:hypothetical protein [Verrucomicrobiales bacterium]